MQTMFKRGLAALTLSALFSLPAMATNPISAPDTMILGDSVFALSGDIHENLEADLVLQVGLHVLHVFDLLLLLLVLGPVFFKGFDQIA